MQLKVLGLQGATSIDLVAAATQKMTAEDVKAVLAKTALEKADLKAILRMHGLSEAEAENTAQTILNSRANVTAASSTNAYTASTNSLKVAFKGLGTAIKSNPIMLIITLLPAVIGLVNKIKDNIEEARNAAIEAGQTTADNSAQLSTLIDSYKQLAEQGIEDVESRNSAAKIQQQIVDLVGAQASNLDLVNGKLDDELGKLQQINKEVTDVATLQSAYENAKDKTGEKVNIHVKSWSAIDTGSEDIKILEDQLPRVGDGKRGLVASIIKEAVGDKGNVNQIAGDITVNLNNLAKEDYKSRLELYDKIIESLRKSGFNSDDAVFSQFLKQKNELQSLYNEQSKAADNLLSGLVQNSYFEQETDVSSLEEYLALREKIIGEVKNEGTVQDMIADNSISNDDIENRVDSYLGGLNQYSDYYNEWYKKFGSDIAKNTEKIRASLLDSGNTKDVNDWIDRLTDKEKEIVFKIETKYGDSNDDWSLEKWQEELTNWQIPETEKFSFSDLIKDDSDNGFKKKVDDYKDKITELDDALADLRNGELSKEDQIKLFENFPELAGQADNLDEALVNLIDDFENNAIDDFNEKLEYMDTDDDVAALNALKNSILGLAKTKNGVADLKSEISKLKTALDDLSDTYSNMQSIIDDYNENGYLTLDNLQSIMDMQPEYINLLIDENGQVNLNSQAYKEYVASKAKSLLVNELQDLYSSILGMKVEEAQAYANAKAYNEETRSVQDLLTATTQLYYAKAMAKDSANNTTAYTDAMSRSFNTAANYASMVDSYINSLSTSQNEFSTSAKSTIDALKEEKKALEDVKDALDDYKDSLEDARSALKDLIDLTIDYIKQQRENVKDALEDQKDSYDKANEAKKEAIELLRKEQEETEKLADLQDQSAKDRLSLAIASLDDSSAGKKAQKQAQDRVKSSDKELRNYLKDQSYDIQLQALDNERKAFDEAIDNQTKKIDEYLKDERKIYEDACNMIDNDNGELYGNLWDYTYKYTTKTKAEFDHLWSSAQTAIQKYKGDNDTLIGTMEYLQGEIYNTDLKIEDLQTAIDITNQTIDDTSTAIDSVATSLDGLGSSIEEYMDKLNAALSASQGLNDGYAGSNNRWFQVEYNGKAYRTESKYGDDNAGNRYLAASEITKLIAKDISGFDQYGLGIVQGLLGVGNTKNTSRHKTWFYDYNGKRLYSYANTRSEAVKEIMSKIGTTDPRAGSAISSNIKSYAKGTRSSVGGISITDENNRYEAKFGKLSSGKYTLMPDGSQVFDSKRTDNLYDFSGNPEEFISKLADRGLSLLSGDELSSLGWGNSLITSQLFDKAFNSPDFVKNLTGVAGTTYNNDNSANNQNINFNMPIYVQGNADQYAVQALNNAADTIKSNIFKELTRMGSWNRRLK